MTGPTSGSETNAATEASVPAGSLAAKSLFPFKLKIREERFVLLLSVFIGIFSGLGVVCFRISIEWLSLHLLGYAPDHWRILLAPAVTGLLIAVLVVHVFPTVRGSGVNQTKAALYIFDGYISLRTAIGKFITAALAIGSGQSLGPEDPSLQIGAALASALGRKLKLSRDRLRLLAPVGASAGLAAAFNAPISAVLFVIEEVIGRWSAGVLGSVVLAAVSSVVVMRWFLGSAPLFRIPAVQLQHPAELLAYVVLGIVGGLASVIFAKGIAKLRVQLKAAPRWSLYFQPAAAGLLIGLIGLCGAPQVMGAGYDFMDQALHNQFTWQVMGVLAALKILATTMSFVSGTPGGTFAPTLFVGAMLGGAVGGVEHILFPQLTSSNATYVLVGMGVLFAGFLRVPMTSVFMVLEVSGNYSIILPVMVANTFAYLISRSLQPMPIFDLLNRQDGLDLPSMEEQREESVLRVEDAMQDAPSPILDGNDTVEAAAGQFSSTTSDRLLIRLHPVGWSSLTREEMEAIMKLGKGEMPLGSLLPRTRIPFLHPDLPLDVALRYMGDSPLLPVVSRADFRDLQGVVSQEDVLDRYKEMDREPVD